MSKCRIQWPVEWLGQKSHKYIGFKNNRHLAFTGEHTVVAMKAKQKRLTLSMLYGFSIEKGQKL